MNYKPVWKHREGDCMNRKLKGGIDVVISSIVICVIIIALLIAIVPGLSNSAKETSKSQTQSLTSGQERISVN